MLHWFYLKSTSREEDSKSEWRWTFYVSLLMGLLLFSASWLMHFTLFAWSVHFCFSWVLDLLYSNLPDVYFCDGLFWAATTLLESHISLSTSMTSSVGLDLFYTQIIPAQTVLFIWNRKNIKPIIYCIWLVERIYSFFDSILRPDIWLWAVLCSTTVWRPGHWWGYSWFNWHNTSCPWSLKA